MALKIYNEERFALFRAVHRFMVVGHEMAWYTGHSLEAVYLKRRRYDWLLTLKATKDNEFFVAFFSGTSFADALFNLVWSLAYGRIRWQEDKYARKFDKSGKPR